MFHFTLTKNFSIPSNPLTKSIYRKWFFKNSDSLVKGICISLPKNFSTQKMLCLKAFFGNFFGKENFIKIWLLLPQNPKIQTLLLRGFAYYWCMRSKEILQKFLYFALVSERKLSLIWYKFLTFMTFRKMKFVRHNHYIFYI